MDNSISVKSAHCSNLTITYTKGFASLSKDGKPGSAIEFISDPMLRIDVMEEMHKLHSPNDTAAELHFQRLRDLNRDAERGAALNISYH